MDGFYRGEGLAGLEDNAGLVDGPFSRRIEAPYDSVGRANADGSITWHSGLPVNWARLGHVNGASRPLDLFLKRSTDVLGSAIALACLAPMLALVALLIKISSPGPVFFRQVREGLNGEAIQVLKFRSMHAERCDLAGIAHTLDNDPRVTKIGRFIRKTSIDELPQLFNVLVGDMSLVGPRPHVPGMLAAGQNYRDIVQHYDERLRMRPGITGWAQANGLRGSASNLGKARDRVHHDIAYVQNFTFWLDLKIIVKTILREFLTGSGN